MAPTTVNESRRKGALVNGSNSLSEGTMALVQRYSARTTVHGSHGSWLKGAPQLKLSLMGCFATSDPFLRPVFGNSQNLVRIVGDVDKTTQIDPSCHAHICCGYNTTANSCCQPCRKSLRRSL